MTIFDRYVFRQAAGATLLILFSLSGVVWIALALKQLKLVTSKGQDMVTLLSMTTLALPNLMALIAPIALLIATVHTLNRLNGDSELIVLTAAGGTIWRVVRPLLFLALLVSIAVSLVNHFAMPWSLRVLRDQVNESRSDLLSQVLLPGRFSSPMPGVTVHIRDRARDGTLLGVIIYDSRKPKELMTYLSEYGQIVKSGNTAYLAMRNGHILRKDGTPNIDKAPEILLFQTYAVDLERFERKMAAQEWNPRERYFSELVWPDTKSPTYKTMRGHYRAELHERFSNPLYPFAFVLIIVAFIGRAQSTRTNQSRTMTIGFVTAVGFRMAGLGVNNTVTLHEAATPLLYVLPIAGMGLGLVMLLTGDRQRRGPGLLDRLDIGFSHLKDRLPRIAFGRSRPQPGE